MVINNEQPFNSEEILDIDRWSNGDMYESNHILLPFDQEHVNTQIDTSITSSAVMHANECDKFPGIVINDINGVSRGKQGLKSALLAASMFGGLGSMLDGLENYVDPYLEMVDKLNNKYRRSDHIQFGNIRIPIVDTEKVSQSEHDKQIMLDKAALKRERKLLKKNK